VPTGRGKNIKIIKAVQPSLRQLKNFVAEVEKINEAQRSVKILLDCSTGPISSKYPYVCTAGTNLIYIGASGDVYPCTAYSSKEASLGNILTTPLREIVKKAGEFQGSLVDKKKKLGKCSRCTNDNCFGGCPGVISAYYGRLDRSFPFCIAYHG
jgi:radical SAM protein with 4Fe4S-binding SPASM domain